MTVKGLSSRLIPSWLYLLARRLGYWPLDLWDALRGDRDPLVPPRRLSFIYGFDPDFRVLGQDFVRHFVELGGLTPDDTVLDIGCGIGRVALPLTGYLSGNGAYRGFDLIPAGIRWCRRHITPRHPNFQFEQADIYNRTYHPRGKYAARQYRFPYEDAFFDFAYTKSVYTHLLPEDTAHYLAETARVLRPGGRCFNTFFLLNHESLRRMERGESTFHFRYAGRGYRAVREREPEKAIAFPEADVRDLHRRLGFRILEPVHYGSWSGRPDFLSGQDIIVAIKQ